ncbi:methyltransferase family protein [Chloroflexota bacterium]
MNQETHQADPQPNNRLRAFKIGRLLRAFAIMGFFIAALFLPAGRLDWWAGWEFLIAFFSATIALTIWMRRRDPALMEERSRTAENVKSWDKVIMGVYTVLLFVMLVVAGLDAGRFGLSDMPAALRALGWLGLLTAYALVWWVMASNPFLSEMVRIQDERGHVVVTTGPYNYVRHPMYVGTITALSTIPLVLGSYWALIPAVLIDFLFVVRTAMEDRTLTEELPGYREYASRIRYRLLPGIW